MAKTYAKVQSVLFLGTQPFTGTLTSTVIGNTLIAVLSHSYLGCPVTLSDNLGNVWTRRLQGDYRSSGANVFYVFTAPVTVAGTVIVTAAASCGSSSNGVLAEYSGIVTGNPFDAGSFRVVNIGSPNSTNIDLTTAENDELLISLQNTPASNATQADSPTVELNKNVGGSRLSAETHAATAGVNTAFHTQTSGSGDNVLWIAGFKQAPSGFTPSPQMHQMMMAGGLM